MKYIKTFLESITNISKKTKFLDNYYDLYELNKSEIGKYLNTWYPGNIKYISDYQKVKSKRGEIVDNFLVIDEIWTAKKVDDYTKSRLYNRNINPICISINCPIGGKFKKDNNGVYLYEMSASIFSIDDSSFRVYWTNYYNNSLPLEYLKEIRLKIVKWVSDKSIINGEEFLDYCISLGANNEKDYN